MSSPTADWYHRAATRDLVGHSALHVAWAAGVAADDEVVALLDRLPRERRQPSLVFSVATYLGAPLEAYPGFRTWLVEHWPDVERETTTRRTQTNEVARCGPLVVALDRVTDRGGETAPIALLEVGAAAGLCMIPDRYSYRFGTHPVVGDGTPLIEVAVSGDGIPPERIPAIAWRRGIDLNPLSAADSADREWLEALIPLDRPDRRSRLRAALATAEVDPPTVVAGDALDDLARVAADAPRDIPLVVVSLGTLVYLAPAARAEFPKAVARLGARLVTLEAEGIADQTTARTAPERTGFVLALDGEPIAQVSPHGDRLSWVG
ncbi:MAG: DUF2332 domain-containing protein [Pseudolysinimonas sp.]|uniref:DUF2332 domain-containing protein n=1 Tax=Pseudolysinimonas sp. TaxID=2680009 RepID=UPI003262FD82